MIVICCFSIDTDRVLLGCNWSLCWLTQTVIWFGTVVLALKFYAMIMHVAELNVNRQELVCKSEVCK